MGGSCSKNTGDDSGVDADKKKKEEAEQEAAALKAKEETETKTKEVRGDKDDDGSTKQIEVNLDRPAGTHRDRIMSLFLVHELEKLPYLDLWLERLQNPRRREGFIREFLEKHGAAKEPLSKLHAVREAISKHARFGGDKVKMQEALNKFKACEAGKELACFEEIFGLKPAVIKDSNSSASGLGLDDDEVEQELSRLERVRSVFYAGDGEEGEGGAREKRERCAPDLVERIVAMLVEYDVERLATLDEARDFPDSEAGAEYLYGLIETFGEEPESKRAAVTDLLREVFEEHDPHRLRSLPTIVAMATSHGGVDALQRLLIKTLRQYGIVKQPLTQKDAIAQGLFDTGASSAATGKRRKAPGMTGGVDRAQQGRAAVVKAAPMVPSGDGDEDDGPLMSNYDKAAMYLEQHAEQSEAVASVAAKLRSMASEREHGLGTMLDQHQQDGSGGVDVPLDTTGVVRGANDDSSSDDDGGAAADEKENAFLPGAKSAAGQKRRVLLPANIMPSAPPSVADN